MWSFSQAHHSRIRWSVHGYGEGTWWNQEYLHPAPCITGIDFVTLICFTMIRTTLSFLVLFRENLPGNAQRQRMIHSGSFVNGWMRSLQLGVPMMMSGKVSYKKMTSMIIPLHRAMCLVSPKTKVAVGLWRITICLMMVILVMTMIDYPTIQPCIPFE